MANSERHVRRTRARKNAGVDWIDKVYGTEAEPAADNGTSEVSMAPTAQLADQRKKQELEICQLKLQLQQEKIENLIKERDYLKEQLSLALKKEDTATVAAHLSSSDSSAAEESNDSWSDSSSDTSSSEDKKKKKKGKQKKYKKSRKMEPTRRKRAQNPDQVVSRYKRILQLHKRGGTMSSAFKRVGVDRNTVVATAPIAELNITAHQKYKDLLKSSHHKKLSVFASECAISIQEDVGLMETVESYKSSGKLLPLKKR